MAKKKPGNPEPKLPPTRGIPADESMWIPRHYGKEIRDKGGLDKAVIWGIEDVVDFVFPRRYQPRYFQVASDFIDLLLKNEVLTKKEISEFLKEKRYSRSTLENKVIPKLVRFGLIKRERELEGALKKGRSLILSESLTFTNYLERIAFAWNSLVSTARRKKPAT
ncbi:MAG: hypothetical protein JW778_08255 [Candidatus Altiarchaeota archaeon]|nr:hypothetical protein [Candidatus Altiarchaeota archaeon]